MTRKDFLKTSLGGFLAAFAYLSGSGCKEETPTTPTIPENDQKTFTSTTVQGHTHTVTISKSEIENPPAGGISRSTSSSSGHTHNFSMTQAELQTVKNGNKVEVSDSIVSNHSHKYVIEKWY